MITRLLSVFGMLFLAAVCIIMGGMGANSSIAAEPAPVVKDIKNPLDGKAEAIQQGGKIFDEKCSECHGDGTGMTAPDLTDDSWIYGGSDAAVFETIQGGRKGGMPSWRSELRRDDIWMIISYIRSLHKK